MEIQALFNPLDEDAFFFGGPGIRYFRKVNRVTARNGAVVKTGTATTALIVEGDARITGILTVGTGSLVITDKDINATGIITGANFKSGTTNVHNVGVELAGVNVLGADTPIGSGATVTMTNCEVSGNSGVSYLISYISKAHHLIFQ